MAFVMVTFIAPGGFTLFEQRDIEPNLGDIVMIGADQFAVQAVLVPDYWSAYGDVNQFRSATVLLDWKPAEAA
ncbi:hypothetical protein [Pseudomonas syringae]|uniref:hypothetical protein n=1 Tax=Pseudomonas syringae TaxID=317 RepID=UPI001011BDAE|nr:hypothetical protein [Pseudomonas syringae]MDU8618486.1 hypothetical protein [Pseudomonas syringae]QNR42561.1 hypothetical protein D5S12_14925 [Pseudomonas syringae]RXT61669.1 hypothetical protein B1F71_25645 [Pseudomonas syringae]RXT90991.1 hypothetical protein B1F75_20070 [Pseudomonas syringae]